MPLHSQRACIAAPAILLALAGSTRAWGADPSRESLFPATLRPPSLDGSNGFAMPGLVAGDMTAHSVSGAGDVNGDDIGDIVIGAWGASPNGQSLAGRTYVVFGRADGTFPAALDLSSLDGTNGFVINGLDANDYSGRSVASAGDFNHDGVGDIIIGAKGGDWLPSRVDSNTGETYIIFGRETASAGPFPASMDPSALDGTNGLILYGIAASDRSGAAVASAGDINGDGVDDVIIGAPYAYAGDGQQLEFGECYVVFGRDTPTEGDFPAAMELWTLDGASGFAISRAGSHYFSGVAVSSAGDFNGDGVDDVMIGAPYAIPIDFPHASRGRAYVVFGRDTASQGDFPALFDLATLDGTNGLMFEGLDVNDRLGSSVSGVGDVNGDGFSDVLMGAPFAYFGNYGYFAGATHVVFGRDTDAQGDFPATFDLASLDGTNGFTMGTYNYNEEYYYLGASVSSSGDVNGDGIDDMIIGAPRAERIGACYVLFGAPDVGAAGLLNVRTLLDGDNGFLILGGRAFDRVGKSVSFLGDMNGDGIDDALIGAPTADPNGQTSAGECYVVFGRRPRIVGPAGAIGGRKTVGRLPQTAGAPPICPADLDADNDTDVFDFAIFANAFGETTFTPSSVDLDGSGAIDVLDFAILAADFGCPD